MAQEKSPDSVKGQDFVKEIFERKKEDASSSKKISSLFGGAALKTQQARPASERKPKEVSSVGIETCAGSFNVAQLAKFNGGWEVYRSAVDAQAGANGSLKQVLSEKGFKGDAVIGLSADDVEFRIINLPPMPAGEVDGAVAWGVAEALGIDARRIHDLSIDYAVISGEGRSSGGRKAFVAAVRKEIVLGKMKAVSDSGLTVVAVEPAPLALYASFCDFFSPDPSKLTLLLNIGYASSALVIGAGRDVYSVRGLSLADKILKGSLADDGSVASDPSVSSALENLIVAVEHSFKSVSNEFPNPSAVSLGAIAVSGAGARYKGLAAFLKKTFNVQAEAFDPLGAGAELASAVGLAMRGKKDDEEV